MRVYDGQQILFIVPPVVPSFVSPGGMSREHSRVRPSRFLTIGRALPSHRGGCQRHRSRPRAPRSQPQPGGRPGVHPSGRGRCAGGLAVLAASNVPIPAADVPAGGFTVSILRLTVEPGGSAPAVRSLTLRSTTSRQGRSSAPAARRDIWLPQTAACRKSATRMSPSISANRSIFHRMSPTARAMRGRSCSRSSASSSSRRRRAWRRHPPRYPTCPLESRRTDPRSPGPRSLRRRNPGSGPT